MNPRRATHLAEQKPMQSVERDCVGRLGGKRRHVWCRSARPPQSGTEPASGFSCVRARGTPLSGPRWHSARTGPLADSKPLGQPLVITRCGHSVPMSQVREVICQQGGQYVLDVSAPSSLRARCVHCCDLRAGSEDTTTYEPQSMLPWPDHAPHGCSHPE